MKRNILTLAFLAAVAVGAAVASDKTASINPAGWDENGNYYDCTGSMHECDDLVIYSDPDVQNDDTRILQSSLIGKKFD